MTPRVITYVMIEMGSLFLVSGGIVVPWSTALTLGRGDLLSLLGQALLPPLCFFASFYCGDLYNLQTTRTLVEFRKRLKFPLLGAFLLLVTVSLVTPSPYVLAPSAWSSLFIILIGAIVLVPLRWGLYAFGGIGPFGKRVLIIGTGELARKVAVAIRSLPSLGYTIAGFVDDAVSEQSPPPTPPLSPVLGRLDRIERIISQFRPHRIIVALQERRGRMPLRALLKAHWTGVRVEDAVTLLERLSGKLAIENLTPGFLIFSTDYRKSPLERALRRVVSVTIATGGLVLCAPLFLIIALAIKLDSTGPVFFVQNRAGLNGRVFPLMKFRTMALAPAEEEFRSVWNRDLATRVTRVGQWLRKTHLDELPQFFNILFGHMDLVGPRPEMADNIQTMEEHIPYYALRMSIRPGVTGWAQIKYGYAVNQEDVTEKIRYDLYYIKNRSLWLDLKIILDTIKLILLGRERLVSRPITRAKVRERAVEG